MRTFRLYPKERHWWSFQDYGAVLDVVTRLKVEAEARGQVDWFRVVEFGPGSSTLSLIEGGATQIDTYEDNPEWEAVYRERLEGKFPDVVTLHRYVWSDPLTIDRQRPQVYDLALVDGPHGTLQRPAVIAWFLQNASAVLVPTEEIAYGRSALRPHLERLASDHNARIEWMETGPLSGGFALMTPPPSPFRYHRMPSEALAPPPSPFPPNRVVSEGEVPARLSRHQRRKAAKKAGGEPA